MRCRLESNTSWITMKSDNMIWFQVTYKPPNKVKFWIVPLPISCHGTLNAAVSNCYPTSTITTYNSVISGSISISITPSQFCEVKLFLLTITQYHH